MSRSKILILLGLVLLMTIPVTIAQAQAPVPTLISAGQRFQGTGTAIISDHLASSDRITLSLTGVTRLTSDQAYEGWLVNSDGPVSIGVIRLDARGNINYNWTSPDGEDLIQNYDTVVISVEPVPDDDPAPSDIKPFVDSVPGGALTHIRHLVSDWPEGSGTGILTDLKGQLDIAIAHATLARNSDNIDDLRTHLHHVINIVEGEDGDNFDDSFGNPGDGIGVIAHAQDRKHAGFAIAAAAGDELVATHGELVEAYGANAENWAIGARDDALNILNEDRLSIAKTLLTEVSGNLDAARNGISATGNGGARQAYTEAQRMATYAFPSKRGVATPVVGDTAVTLLAQMALLGSLALLASGGFVLYRERRAKVRVKA